MRLVNRSTVTRARKPRKATGRIGRAFETRVEAAAFRTCEVIQLPRNGARFIPGGKTKLTKMPFDHLFLHRRTRRAFTIDAKSDECATSFAVGDRTHLTDFQRRELCKAGRGGAIAGVIVEGSSRDVDAIFWLSWRYLAAPPPSIRWDDPRFVRLCGANELIDFDKLIRIDDDERMKHDGKTNQQQIGEGAGDDLAGNSNAGRPFELPPVTREAGDV